MSHRNRTTLSDTGVALRVRASMARADLAARLAEGSRARALHDGEEGSMTAEYAMVGGVGAAAAGAVIACIQNQDVIERVLKSVVDSLVDTVGSWF